MSRKSFAAIVLAAGLVAGGAGAQAAVLSQVQGSVFVNSGSGFVPATVGTAVEPGDQVSVQGPGNATIDFGEGKFQNVPGSSTVVVRAPGLLASGLTTPVVVGGIAVAGAAVGIAAAANTGSDNPVFPFPPVSP